MASKLPTRRTGQTSLRGASKSSRRARPALELFEPRLLLSGFNYLVDSMTDTGSGSGLVGDLRYAITNANFNPGSTITIQGSGTVNLTSSLPDIAVDMTIVDSNPGDFVLNGGGSGSNYRALAIDNGASATISGVDFTNFATTGNGGILLVDGSLGLVDSTLSLSSAASGGAVFISIQGSLTANGSSFHDNASLNSGGAIYCDNDLDLIGGSLLNNSAGGGGGAVFVDGLMSAFGVEIAGNVASADGGGIEAGQGMGSSGLTITNSTIAENAAENSGGGVVSFFTLTLTNDTISGNSSAVSQGGAGLYIPSGVQPILNNTVIAQNLSNGIESDVDGPGSIDSTSSYNLVGNASASGIADGTLGNQIGSSGSPLDADLGLLTNNGGTNETIAPNIGSPAIGAGLVGNAVDPTTANPIPFDQRGVGFDRVVGGSIDIGAFQTQSDATTLAVTGASGTYGGTAKLTATLTSGGSPVSGELVDFHVGATDFGTASTDVNGTATLDNATLGFVDAGHYTGDVTASFAGDSSFSASSGAADLDITPAPLTVVADNQSKVYGQTNPVFTGTVSGILNGDDVTASYASTAGQFSDVQAGGYDITLLGLSGAKAVDYSTTVVGGSVTDGILTVAQAPLSIAADDQTKVYGDAVPSLTGSISGILNGDDVSATFATIASPGSNVDDGPFAITLAGLTGAKAADYSTTVIGGSFTPGTLSITAASLTIRANDQTKVYGSALPSLTASYTGFVNGDTTTNLTSLPTISTTATAASHVAGSPYAITAFGAVDDNYTISYVAGSLAVTPAPLTITADDQSKVYGDALPTLTASYTGLVNGDTSASLDILPTLSTTATAASHVSGSPFGITAGGAVDPDYTISYVAGSLAVTPAPLTITADDQTKVYGAALPSLTASFTGFVNGDTSASLDNPPTLSSIATASSHVAGSPYAITAGGAVDPDYSISYVSGSLSVTMAPLTIMANDQTKVYGSALPTLTASFTGLVNGDTSASLATLPTLSTAATAASHVAGNPYNITVGGAVDSDYAISYVAGSLDVTTSPLTITANDQAKVYGSALPTLTASYTGLVNGDTSASLASPPTLSSSASTFSGVAGSPYAVNAAAAVDPDYSISYVPGTLAVTPAPLTVVIDDLSKLYGQANPTFTETVTGILNGDDVAADDSTTAGQFSDVQAGGYAITFSGLSGAQAADYSTTVAGGSVTAGTLSIVPAPLAIVANNQTKVYGQPDPVLTGTVAGVLNGDDVTAQFATTATATSDVVNGGYPITSAGLSGLKAIDYLIANSVAGSLTVTPAPLTITAVDASKTYGQANPAFSANFGGFVLGQGPGALSGVLGFSSPATAASHVGSYPITPTGLTSVDYAIVADDGSLSITPAPLQVTAPTVVKTYGQAVPNLVASFSGFVNGDTSASLATRPTLSTSASAASHVAGSPYAVTAGGAVDPDYSISYVPGSVSVTPAPLTITAVNQSKVYGAALPTLTASYSGFVNGDTPASLAAPVSLATTANASSHVGQYPIVASGASSSDYATSFVNGAISVNPASLTVTANDAVKSFVGPLPLFSATYRGFVNGDTAASLATPISLSTTATATDAAGDFPINVGGETSPDYSIVNVPGTLDIQQPLPTSLDSGEVAFVTSLYQTILGRTPEAGGLALWTSELSRGVSGSSVALHIYQSPEAHTFRAHHRGHAISFGNALAEAKLARANAGRA